MRSQRSRIQQTTEDRLRLQNANTEQHRNKRHADHIAKEEALKEKRLRMQQQRADRNMSSMAEGV
jgi:hypothetical protein